MSSKTNPIITDEAHERLERIIRLRLPWLILGLLGGTAASITVSRFEEILSENISLVFFLPIIVYMSDAIGTQTETMYVRTLSKVKVHFVKNVVKEIAVGLCLGGFLGSTVGVVAWLWIGSLKIALTVGLAMFVNAVIAPVISLIVPEILFKRHSDPALGAGPVTTIIQDLISLLIYFLIAVIIFGQGL